MKKIFTAFAALLISLGFGLAQTNFFPVLRAGTETYQNARIVTNTPSYAVVFFDGGAAHVAFSNLPPEVQKQYHYDPLLASKFEKEKKEDLAKRKKAEADATLAKQQQAVARAVADQIARSNNFKPLEIKWTNYFGAIHGVVTNNTDYEFESVNVTFDLSKGNKQIKTDTEISEYLGPHCIWEPRYVKDVTEMGCDAKMLEFTYRKKEQGKKAP